MAKPTVMKVQVPLEDTKDTDPLCNSCVLTTVLCSNDVIQYYEGTIETGEVKTTDYKNIRQVIQDKNEKSIGSYR